MHSAEAGKAYLYTFNREHSPPLPSSTSPASARSSSGALYRDCGVGDRPAHACSARPPAATATPAATSTSSSSGPPMSPKTNRAGGSSWSGSPTIFTTGATTCDLRGLSGRRAPAPSRAPPRRRRAAPRRDTLVGPAPTELLGRRRNEAGRPHPTLRSYAGTQIIENAQKSLGDRRARSWRSSRFRPSRSVAAPLGRPSQA